MRIRHEKTRTPHFCELSEVARDLFLSLPGEQPLDWNTTEKCYYRRWKRICQIAEVPYGATQKIRKTAATLLWLEDEDNPSRVQRFLGHRTPTMWEHYVDTSQGKTRPPKPPRLSA